MLIIMVNFYFLRTDEWIEWLMIESINLQSPFNLGLLSNRVDMKQIIWTHLSVSTTYANLLKRTSLPSSKLSQSLIYLLWYARITALGLSGLGTLLWSSTRYTISHLSTQYISLMSWREIRAFYSDNGFPTVFSKKPRFSFSSSISQNKDTFGTTGRRENPNLFKIMKPI